MSIVGILFGRSLENPKTSLSDPDEWLYDALGGEPSSSGVRVNLHSSLKYSPVWRGVNLISRDVAKLPLFVYERVTLGKSEGKQKARNHPAFRLLRHKPNREMTAFVFRQTLMAHALLDGNGLAYISRRGDGTPIELIPLLPGVSSPVRVDGRLWYVTEIRGEPRRLPPEDVIHIKGLGYDGLSGYPLYYKARDSWGGGMAAQQYGSRFFRNNARPSVVLEHPNILKKEVVTRLRESWNEIHAGLENSHKVAILEEGMKLHPFSINARDAQLLELRQFEIREVANWIGVPPHKLGDTTRTAFASLEQENQSYLDDALDPWLVNWEEEFRDKLLTEREKAEDTHVIEFVRQALIRADMKTRGEFYTKATGGHPWMSVNEVRALENRNPVEGFDDIKTPTNNFGNTAEPEPNNPDSDGTASVPARAGRQGGRVRVTARRIANDAIGRAVRRLSVHALRASKDKRLTDWLCGGMEPEHRTVLEEMLDPAAALLRDVFGTECGTGRMVDAVLDGFRSLPSGDLAGALESLEANLPNRIVGQLTGEQHGT